MIDLKSQIFKAGYVAIVGEPNVGKSTLLNAMLGQKISIVTSKPQTTRQRIIGIFNQQNAQIVFLDTPGLIKPKYLLHDEMLKHAESALDEADIILLMTHPRAAKELPEEVLKRILPHCKVKPVFLVINKADTANKLDIQQAIQSYAKLEYFEEIIPISALKGNNIEKIIELLIHYLPEHDAYFPIDIVSEFPERFFVAEFIREQIFNNLREEIPYSTAVEIREFKEREKGKTFINADIIVERDSQKGIVIGKNGEALKIIGTAARKEIETFLEQKVYLELHVKVREKWRESEAMIRKLGYKNKD
jgi:GTP-binding protein Era